jgi:hypothetical protein
MSVSLKNGAALGFLLLGDDRNAVDIYCTYLAYRYSVGGHPIEGSVEIPDKWETGR